MITRICKHCGSEIHFKDSSTASCPTCKKEMSLKETLSSFTLQQRIKQLQNMHNLMTLANDETIYLSWVYLIPDCPSEDDFVDIALDDDLYNECFDKFIKLIAYKDNRY